MTLLRLLNSLGVAFLLAGGAVDLVSSSPHGQTPRVQLEEGNSTVDQACQGILAQYDINSTQFLEVCGESSFQTAYAERGVQDFFGGRSQIHGYEVDYYGFGWNGACQNSSRGGGQCSEQEYWAVSESTGAVSGPFYQEGLPACAGCPEQSPLFSPIGLIGIAIICVAVVTFVVLLRKRQRHILPPGELPGSDSSNPGGPSG